MKWGWVRGKLSLVSMESLLCFISALSKGMEWLSYAISMYSTYCRDWPNMDTGSDTLDLEHLGSLFLYFFIKQIQAKHLIPVRTIFCAIIAFYKQEINIHTGQYSLGLTYKQTEVHSGSEWVHKIYEQWMSSLNVQQRTVITTESFKCSIQIGLEVLLSTQRPKNDVSISHQKPIFLWKTVVHFLT